MEHAESLDHDPDFERPIGLRRQAVPRRSLVWPAVMVAAVVAAGVFAWRAMHTLQPVAPPTMPPSAAVAAPKPAPAESTPRYPIESAAAAAGPAAAPLPLPGESDSALQEAMAGVFSAVPLDRVFYLQQIVPRFVATIDNLPRQTAALQRMPVKPVGGSVETTESGGRILLRADNAERYSAYMRVMEQAETRKLVETYAHFYPLFQSAYEELGYPHAYFNDRLVEVIDHLLAAPDVPAPVELAQPKVLLEYADPSLEKLSAGQKILIRLGPVDESRVKAKLRDIRRELTGRSMAR